MAQWPVAPWPAVARGPNDFCRLCVITWSVAIAHPPVLCLAENLKSDFSISTKSSIELNYNNISHNNSSHLHSSINLVLKLIVDLYMTPTLQNYYSLNQSVESILIVLILKLGWELGLQFNWNPLPFAFC